MKRLYEVPDDFEAIIRVFSPAEGGRRTPACNGIRWDFAYAVDEAPGELYMIWPDFVDDAGDSLSAETALPTDIELKARMTVLVDDMREKVHRLRVRTGVEFFCHEGGKRVAKGRVTRVTGLFADRPNKGTC